MSLSNTTQVVGKLLASKQQQPASAASSAAPRSARLGDNLIDPATLTGSEVIVVDVVCDDSASMGAAGIAQMVAAQNAAVEIVAEFQSSKNIQLSTLLLNGGVVRPFCGKENLAGAKLAQNEVRYANNGTPLYRTIVQVMEQNSAIEEHLKAYGFRAHFLTVVVTDGADWEGDERKAERVQRLEAARNACAPYLSSTKLRKTQIRGIAVGESAYEELTDLLAEENVIPVSEMAKLKETLEKVFRDSLTGIAR